MLPPRHDVHPMRLMFWIPKWDPPTLSDTTGFSKNFIELIQLCLQKDYDIRPSAETLLTVCEVIHFQNIYKIQHEFFTGQSVESSKSLKEIIELAIPLLPAYRESKGTEFEWVRSPH